MGQDVHDFLQLEKAGPPSSDAQHIFNKAIFDGLQEALLQVWSQVGCSHLFLQVLHHKYPCTSFNTSTTSATFKCS